MKAARPYLEHAARGANDWWRYLLTFVVAPAVAVVFTVVLVLALILVRRWPADFAAQVQDPAHPVSFFGFNGLVFLLLLVAFVLAIRLLHGKRFADVIGAWSWRRFAAGFAIWAAVLVIGVLVDLALAPKGLRFSANRETPALAAMACAALAVQTFAEEFVFRGYLTQGLLLGLRRPVLAAVVSGLLFGALHIPNGAPQAASAACFGVALALIAMRTGGIAFTYGLHLINNLFGAVVVVSTGDAFHGSPGLFTQTTTPTQLWWDAAIGVATLAVVAWLVFRATASEVEADERGQAFDQARP